MGDAESAAGDFLAVEMYFAMSGCRATVKILKVLRFSFHLGSLLPFGRGEESSPLRDVRQAVELLTETLFTGSVLDLFLDPFCPCHF